jgi:hypothetical protein
MKRLSLLLLLLLLAWAAPHPAAAADARDDFVADPRFSADWDFSWGWVWSAGDHRVSSSPLKSGTAIRTASTLEQGVFSAWVRVLPLEAPAQPRAGLLFGWQSQFIHHAVTLVAGNPGKVILSRRALVGGVRTREVIDWKPAAILPLHWYRLDVHLRPGRSLKIFLTDE